MSENLDKLNFFKLHAIDNLNPTKIGKSEIHGLGLFASEDMDENAVIGALDGQKMSWDEYNILHDKLSKKLGELDTYFFMEWNLLNQMTLLVRPIRTKYSFINHSRTPCLRLNRELLVIYAVRNIKKDEELTIDYREEPLPESYINGYGKTFL